MKRLALLLLLAAAPGAAHAQEPPAAGPLAPTGARGPLPHSANPFPPGATPPSAEGPKGPAGATAPTGAFNPRPQPPSAPYVPPPPAGAFGATGSWQRPAEEGPRWKDIAEIVALAAATAWFLVQLVARRGRSGLVVALETSRAGDLASVRVRLENRGSAALHIEDVRVSAAPMSGSGASFSAGTLEEVALAGPRPASIGPNDGVECGAVTRAPPGTPLLFRVTVSGRRGSWTSSAVAL